MAQHADGHQDRCFGRLGTRPYRHLRKRTQREHRFQQRSSPEEIPGDGRCSLRLCKRSYQLYRWRTIRTRRRDWHQYPETWSPRTNGTRRDYHLQVVDYRKWTDEEVKSEERRVKKQRSAAEGKANSIALLWTRSVPTPYQVLVSAMFARFACKLCKHQDSRRKIQEQYISEITNKKRNNNEDIL